MRALLWCGVVGVMFMASAAVAHDGDVVTSFDAFVPQEYIHEDADPFKGWINVTVTNTGSEPWGDFHFGIFDPIGGQNISNVHFLDEPPYEPYSSQNPLTWLIDNEVVGATIDLFYYADPVMPGETADFHVYTDNPDQLSFFGVLLYPTPVPEPASLALLAFGAAMLIRRKS